MVDLSMGRNTQVACVEAECKRLMLLGGSLCGKTPVIHNFTTYKHAITFQYHIMSKIPNNLIINTA
jgi:GTPase SAR1 family protein